MKSRIPDPSRRRGVQIGRDRPTLRPNRRSPFVRGIQLLAMATTGGAIMLASLAGLAFLRSGSRFIEGINLALTPQPPEQSVDIRTVVVKQVREVSELTTAVFTMEAVVPAQSSRKLGEFTIGQTNLLYVAHGEVRAGVDLEELTTADVISSEAGRSIKLVLPPPRILGTDIDVDRSTVYDYSRGLFSLGPDTAPELQELAQREAKGKIEKAACEQDILGQANDRAELVVTQLLQSAGFEEVIVETAPAANTACESFS
ncbi:hypothetical protein S7335_1620 [Synechococcus sp. PCC 7335]|uniref:DUF4230 domain-containing protein n=1 Tax=Synechococcus sp. (strain ATCC 29403 / PCC 7335) TaxID=91464 RepID=UPI00017EC354|nr:DUF4230 domain-containing protein [Synechococcus sp. PCC 7335]EDX83923.1 hypothetical protein S7335_1620 [Synechococcus sp. PCC 7335]